MWSHHHHSLPPLICVQFFQLPIRMINGNKSTRFEVCFLPEICSPSKFLLLKERGSSSNVVSSRDQLAWPQSPQPLNPNGGIPLLGMGPAARHGQPAITPVAVGGRRLEAHSGEWGREGGGPRVGVARLRPPHRSKCHAGEKPPSIAGGGGHTQQGPQKIND